MTTDRMDEILYHICSGRRFLKMFLAFSATLLLLALFSLPYVERGTRAFVVLQLDFAITTVTLLLVIVMIAICSRRE